MRKLDNQKFFMNLSLSIIFIAFTIRFLNAWKAYIIYGIVVLFLCVYLSLQR